MTKLKLLKTLPDGRVVEFHQPKEISINMVTLEAEIKIHSWRMEADCSAFRAPDSVESIKLQLPDWNAEYCNDLLGFVINDPEWQGGELVIS